MKPQSRSSTRKINRSLNALVKRNAKAPRKMVENMERSKRPYSQYDGTKKGTHKPKKKTLADLKELLGSPPDTNL